jgi:replicative DNA helicase
MAKERPAPSMPEAIDAEKTILGAIMLDNKAFYEVAESIGPEDFFLNAHQRIFAVMAALAEDQEVIDIITMTNRHEKRGELSVIGGGAYISSLIDGVPHSVGVDSYVKILREKAILRRAVHLGRGIEAKALEHFANAAEVVAKANDGALSLTMESRQRTAEPLSAIIPRMHKELVERQSVSEDRPIGLRTGLKKLDASLKGYHLGEYVIISGATGDGKTSLALQAIIANMFDSVPTLMFSKEMTAESIAMRLLAAVGDWSHEELRDPRGVDMYTFQKLPALLDNMGKWPLWVDDASGLHIREVVARIRAFARRHKRVNDPRLLVVLDYLQLVNGDGDNTVERLNHVSGSVRDLTKREKLAMLALSQYSRPEGKVKRRPSLMDLKGSGQLEQDAFTVLACYRPQDEYTRYQGSDEILALKNRNGETGLAAKVKYDTKKLIFEEREDKHKDE